MSNDKLFSVVVRNNDGTLRRAGYCWASTVSLAEGWAWSGAARRGEKPEDITIRVEEQ